MDWDWALSYDSELASYFCSRMALGRHESLALFRGCVLLVEMAQGMNTGKHKGAFQPSAYIMSSTSPLAKANPMVQPGIRMGGRCKAAGA